VPGRRIADDVIRYAQSHNLTQIVIGKSTRSRWFEVLHGSVATISCAEPAISASMLLLAIPSLFASVASALCYNFFFTEPYYTFGISDPRHCWLSHSSRS
jgi:K+-sensing histidine kinase KdpD